MNAMFRRSLMAGAVAALFSMPAWGGGYGGSGGYGATSGDAPRTQPMERWQADKAAQSTHDGMGAMERDFRENPTLAGPQGRIRELDPRPGESLYESPSDFAAFEPMEGGMHAMGQDFRQNPTLTGPQGRIRPLDPRPDESIYR